MGTIRETSNFDIKHRPTADLVDFQCQRVHAEDSQLFLQPGNVGMEGICTRAILSCSCQYPKGIKENFEGTDC